MEEIRWWTWLLVASSVIAVILLLAAPTGYKFGITGLQPSLMSLLVALLTAVLVFLISLAMVFVAHKNGLVLNRNLALFAMGVSLIPMLVMMPRIQAARSVPAIHDITTDTANPPGFHEIAGIREEAPNDLQYGTEKIPPAEHAELQHEAYPEIKPLETSLSVGEAVDRAREVLEAQGHEIVNVNRQAGIVEATATTFWFGFKDDMVVRVTATDSGSIVDVRSVSRVGQSDIGANAARIQRFLDAFSSS